MTSFSITVPLPNRGVLPNARRHWAAKSKLTKAQRRAAALSCLQLLAGSKPPAWRKARAQVIAYFPTTRHPDPDNFMAGLKASFDGIADAGVIVNDRDLWPERPQFFKDKENPRVQITIIPE